MSQTQYPAVLHDLLHQYNQDRNTSFTPHQFEQLLYFVPLLMVAVSDMSVDGIEMGYLTGVVAEQTVVDAANDSSVDARMELLNNYIAEIKYLMAHMTTWESQVMLVLRQLLDQAPEQRHRVHLRMLAMAMASRGINVYEQAKIQDVSQQLGISL